MGTKKPGGARRISLCLSVLAVSGLTVGSSTVSAQTREVLLLAGGGFAFRSFSQYTGAIIPFKTGAGGFSQDGPVMRLWQKSFAFSYTTDLAPAGRMNTRIDAVGGSITGEFGYQKKLAAGRIAGYAGLTYRRFELSPDDPGADLNKNALGIPLTIEGQWSLNDRISLSSNLTYSILHEDYWAQLKFGYQTSSVLKLGPEVVLQGGSEYRYMRLGAFFSGIKLGKVNLGFNFGLRNDLRENKQSLYGDMNLSFFY